MNTIYDGTFVLGNTSATTYQAGPGISITQPSEGTVRISNDETVLWSGDLAYGNSATLSDSVQNFEKIRFKWTDWGSTQSIHYDEFAAQSGIASYYSMVGSWYGGSSPTANITLFKLNCHDNGNNVMSFDNAIFLATTANTVNLANQTRITEIVGINRISGSNA